MKLSKQIFDYSRFPRGFQKQRTSSLLNDGLVVHFNDAAIPIFTPLGSTILRNVEDILSRSAEKSGASAIKIPMIMRNALLEQGQEVGRKFDKKTIRLDGGMQDFHLMTSPEMMFINVFNSRAISHRHLPIHHFYNADFCRNMPDPKQLLRGRQLRVFGGVAFDKDEDARDKTARRVERMIEAALDEMGLPFHKEPGSSGFTCEYFYLSRPNEDAENYVLSSIDPNKRTRAISFGMSYTYFPDNLSSAFQYQDHDNSYKTPKVTSYALSTQRILHCVMDCYRDEKGFNLPENLRPFDVVVIPLYDSNVQESEAIDSLLSQIGYRVAVDDFCKKRYKERLANANYLGSPLNLTVGKGYYTLKARDGNIVFQTEKRAETLERLVNSKTVENTQKIQETARKSWRLRTFHKYWKG